MNFYNFSAKTIAGQDISMNDYKGKILLVVNTASKCGLTPQFKELESLYNEFKSQDFEILGFPCAQFNNQELESNDEISNFCQINYGVTFRMFAKINVNGEQAHPIYKYLKNEAKGILNKEIKWNFTKFLIDQNGNVIKRYAPTTKPSKIKDDIKALINRG